MTGQSATAAGLAEVFATIGPLYRRAVRVISDTGDDSSVPVGVRAVLELLHARDAAPVPDIAADLELSRQFVQRTVNDARARGLVEPRPNPRHRRSALIGLTAAGDQHIRAIHARELEAMLPAAAELAAEDVEACLRVLRHLHGHLHAEG